MIMINLKKNVFWQNFFGFSTYFCQRGNFMPKITCFRLFWR